MEERKITEFKGIYTRLKCRNAFWYVAKPRCYGLERKFELLEKKLQADIFESIEKYDLLTEVTKVLYSEDFYGLKCLNQTDQEYAEALKQYGITPRSKPIVEDLELLYNQLKESCLEEDPISDKEQPIGDKEGPISDKEEPIGEKRAKLQRKAFSAPVPPFKTKKTNT